MKDRAITLPDFCVKASYFFKDPTTFDEQARAKNWKPETAAHLTALSEAFSALDEFTTQAAEQALRATAQALGVGAGALIHPVRLAVTGVSNGPGLFATLEVLGKEVVTRRIAFAIKTLGV
jgi:glutamyl-tRNA synthetase